MDCGVDTLDFYEGEHPNNKRIGKYCGYWVPSIFTSSSNTLFLNFISGRNPRGVGFQFFFEQVDPIGKFRFHLRLVTP